METNSSYSKPNLSYRTNKPRKLGKSYIYSQIYSLSSQNSTTNWDQMFRYMGPWELCLIQRTQYTDFAGPSNSTEENSLLQRLNILSALFQALSAGILHQHQMTEQTMVGNGLSFVQSTFVTGRTMCQTENTRNRITELLSPEKKPTGS